LERERNGRASNREKRNRRRREQTAFTDEKWKLEKTNFNPLDVLQQEDVNILHESIDTRQNAYLSLVPDDHVTFNLCALLHYLATGRVHLPTLAYPHLLQQHHVTYIIRLVCYMSAMLAIHCMHNSS
jgi:hypothetical protein